jgi:predicted 3-demethylubiquinone-9 3-methyltransferase (glyoxalase superfamily)
MCGWLRDRFGVSWQIVPKVVVEIMSGGDGERMEKTMMAVMKSGKIIVRDVEDAVGTA